MSILRKAAQQALEALEASRRSHYYCEDTWYSCPKHEDGCSNEMEGDECNCGADEANEKIDQSITALRAALAQPEPRNQCGETCERATLCAVCAREVEQEEATCKESLPVEPKGGWQSAPSLERRGPVATVESGVLVRSSLKQDYTGPLYTDPPRREWVSLTEEEIMDAFDDAIPDYVDVSDAEVIDLARAIEQALKEKNHE